MRRATIPADEDELDVAGAGDQGMMFGYASNETDGADAAADLARAQARQAPRRRCARARSLPYLRPDGKTQVTVRYEDGTPVEIEKLLISTQHADGIDSETLIKPDLLGARRAAGAARRALRREEARARTSSSTRPGAS